MFSLEYYVTAVLFHVLTLSHTSTRFAESARRGRKAYIRRAQQGKRRACTVVSFILPLEAEAGG